MINFLKSIFSKSRSFSSYDECPKVFYRFNKSGEYGPQKLDRAIAFKGITNRGQMEGRFADEKEWHSWRYFEDLWQRIPPSLHTLKRLRKEGVPESGLSESRARVILHDRQSAKPATAAQLQELHAAGIDTEQTLDRAEAKNLAKESKLEERNREEKRQQDNQRITDAGKISAAKKRLSDLALQITIISPEWQAPDFSDLEPLEEYIRSVEEALDHALLYDQENLQGGPFTDPTKTSSDYYLEFEGEIRVSELRAFQGRLFAEHLEKNGEDFDHLKALRDSFSNLKVSKL